VTPTPAGVGYLLNVLMHLFPLAPSWLWFQIFTGFLPLKPEYYISICNYSSAAHS